MLEEIREILRASSEEKYRDFNRSLIPGDTSPMLGVRLPKLRTLAKRIAKKKGKAYLRALCEAEGAGQVYFEELLLHGMVAGYLECGSEERKEILDKFIPVIDNWSVCDSSCITYKFMKEDREGWFSYLLKYSQSENEYEVRFAVVSMLNFFVTEQFIDRILEALGQIHQEGYYVKMAAAWAVSACYVQFPEKTEAFLLENRLDVFTHNKAIQKIRESLQVSREEKEMLLSLRR